MSIIYASIFVSVLSEKTQFVGPLIIATTITIVAATTLWADSIIVEGDALEGRLVKIEEESLRDCMLKKIDILAEQNKVLTARKFVQQVERKCKRQALNESASASLKNVLSRG